MMNLIFMAILSLVTGDKITWTYEADDVAGVEEALKKAKEEAKKSDKVVMAYFTAEWASSCELMEKVVFSKKKVIERVTESCVTVRIDCAGVQEDADLRTMLVDDFGFNQLKLPTVLFLNAAGETLEEQKQASGPVKFLKKLNDALKKVSPEKEDERAEEEEKKD